jgi:hypothetical protein
MWRMSAKASQERTKVGDRELKASEFSPPSESAVAVRNIPVQQKGLSMMTPRTVLLGRESH